MTPFDFYISLCGFAIGFVVTKFIIDHWEDMPWKKR